MIFPITFSIPEAKIIEVISRRKKKFLSNLIPGKPETYIYNTEQKYNNEYQQSFFAVTMKKAGWDCLRHYEIIANGCIPYFIDIESCPENTLKLFPKDLIKKGNKIYLKYKDKKLDSTKTSICFGLIDKLIKYMREHLTTKKMAEYILNKVNKKDVKSILFLSGITKPDYLRCLTLHGFKEIFGSNCHDHPQIKHLYKMDNYDYSKLYGKGFIYTNLLDPENRNDNLDLTIEEDIKNKKYDIIIYGNYHLGMPYFELVDKTYDKENIILLCGEDIHKCESNTWDKKGYNVFVREM